VGVGELFEDDSDVDILTGDDAEALERARAAGTAGQPRRIVHRLRAPNAEAADALAAIARNYGYETEIRAPEATASERADEWRVEARKEVVLDEQHVSEARTLIAELAAEHGADYDGWQLTAAA
jgi:hypothetical protein